MYVMLQFVGDVKLRTARLFLHDALSDQSTIRNQQVSQAKSYAAFKIIGHPISRVLNACLMQAHASHCCGIAPRRQHAATNDAEFANIDHEHSCL
jgi:hypothetical protein